MLRLPRLANVLWLGTALASSAVVLIPMVGLLTGATLISMGGALAVLVVFLLVMWAGLSWCAHREAQCAKTEVLAPRHQPLPPAPQPGGVQALLRGLRRSAS